VAYDVDASTVSGATTTILQELLDASRRGVAVHVLLNASLLLDTAKPLRAHLAAVGADSRVARVRGVSAVPQLLHAKMVLVDDDADGRRVGRGPSHRPTDDPRGRVVRTAPRNGPTEILSALLDGIASARRSIYIEHQYLSARPVVAALVRALAQHRSLEVILLL